MENDKGIEQWQKYLSFCEFLKISLRVLHFSFSYKSSELTRSQKISSLFCHAFVHLPLLYKYTFEGKKKKGTNLVIQDGLLKTCN